MYDLRSTIYDFRMYDRVWRFCFGILDLGYLLEGDRKSVV